MEYTYVGYTEEKRIVKGSILAASEQTALNRLSALGYRIASLRPVVPFMPDLGRFSLSTTQAKPAEIITFSRQLALLLESGTDIVRSLELIKSHATSRSMTRVLGDMVDDLRAGNSFSGALAKHPRAFPTIYQKMMAVAEHTGGFEILLRQLADYMDKEQTTAKKLKQAMTYPTIVMVVAAIVIGVMFTIVLPPIISMFTNLGADLPVITRALIAVVNLSTQYGLYVLLGLLIFVLLGLLFSQSPAGRYQRDRLLLRLPVMGRLLQVTELSRCCRNMALLFRAGLPLPEIIDLTAETSNNRVLARALESVEQQMLKGEGLAQPMTENPFFLPLMVEMAKVGEETGNIDGTLMTVAETYEVEADDRTRSLLGMIEPALTVAMGLLVAFIALSIFMPIYGMLGSIAG